MLLNRWFFVALGLSALTWVVIVTLVRYVIERLQMR
jgi:hypothetical protein